MRIEINGVRLFFDVEGAQLVADGPRMRDKPTVVFLHGAPGAADHSGFKPLFGRLADVAQLVYLDLRGCGRSEAGPQERLTLEQWADDVRAFCAELEIEKPIVLGQSGGGFVTIAYGTRHPEHPAKLILASTQAQVVPERIVAVIRRRATSEVAALADRWVQNADDPEAFAGWLRHVLPLYNHAPQDPDTRHRVILQMDTWWSFARLWYRGRPNLLPQMSRIRCPTLILHGEDDPICPFEDAEDMLHALPPGIGRLHRFAQCGHGVWRDHPEEAMRIIREFIEK